MKEADGGQILKAIRLHLGLSQDEFARLLGTTATTVSRRERHVYEEMLFTLDEMLRLEEALLAAGKRLSDFMTSESPKNNA